MKRICIYLISCLIVTVVFDPAYGQDTLQNRSITSDDFASKRPAARTSGRSRRARYSFLRAEKNVAQNRRSSPRSSPAKATVPPVVSEIGVTMWRLRPPQKNETGHFFEVIDGSRGRHMWLAERVGPDTGFKPGEKIRFAIESSLTGYLYVFNRETSTDGSLGAPSLIFPDSIRDDNSVGPGVLVDIPDQRDDVPYFNITPQGPNYAGELLTVVITTKPLTDLKVERDGTVVSVDDLLNLEFNADVEVFSRTDTEDKFYSKIEADAACGGRSRGGKEPCGLASRKLTRDEPLPQAIFRAKSQPGEPVVVFVKLNVQK